MTISFETREFVRSRASNMCEYCRLPEEASALPHQIDHIIGRQHQGSDDVGNLCLACIRCNQKKGSNIASVDPQTQRVVTLYHPRAQLWVEHFQLVEARILGATAEGRATVALLDTNNETRVRIRTILLGRGWLP